MDELLQRLNAANRSLGNILADLEVGADKSVNVMADELQCVLSSLAQVHALPKAQLEAASTDDRIGTQLNLYRSRLTRLQQLLPAIHIRLLSERARLEKQRLHLTSASAWAESNRETLSNK